MIKDAFLAGWKAASGPQSDNQGLAQLAWEHSELSHGEVARAGHDLLKGSEPASPPIPGPQTSASVEEARDYLAAQIDMRLDEIRAWGVAVESDVSGAIEKLIASVSASHAATIQQLESKLQLAEDAYTSGRNPMGVVQLEIMTDRAKKAEATIQQQAQELAGLRRKSVVDDTAFASANQIAVHAEMRAEAAESALVHAAKVNALAEARLAGSATLAQEERICECGHSESDHGQLNVVLTSACLYCPVSLCSSFRLWTKDRVKEAFDAGFTAGRQSLSLSKSHGTAMRDE